MLDLPDPFARHDPFGSIAEAKQTERKVSRPTPNVANLIRDHLDRRVPTPVLSISDLWFCGSNVWRFLYGETPDPRADLDVFCATRESYDRLAAIIGEVYGCTPEEDRPEIQRSRGVGGVGFRCHTTFGWVDAWHEELPPFIVPLTFPEDGYAHCRAMFLASGSLLIVIPNLSATAIGGEAADLTPSSCRCRPMLGPWCASCLR